ncbi:MAG TPA: hypothetical protein VGF13_21185 [Verrucomicrobiae bacterium]|jgi:hypothetical protein
MENIISTQPARLLTQAEDAADGAHAHEAAIGIQLNKELFVRAAFTLLLTREGDYQAARTGKLNAGTAQRTADDEAKVFITSVRDRMKKELGNTWSQQWVELGFVNNSFGIPRTMAERQAILLPIKAYLTAHPDFEVEDLDITADEAQARYTAISTARSTVNACTADVAVKKALRDSALKAMRKCLRGLVTELKQLMPGDDGRWHAFGFNPPSAVGVPAMPEGLTVIPSAPGHLLAKWLAAALAARYRLYRKIIGVDSDYVAVKTVTELEADLNTMTSGQVVRIRVSSANDAGESPLSDAVEVTVP